MGPRVPSTTGCAAASSPRKAAMSPKSFLLTLGIFCGGYVSNTLLDEVVDAAEKYLHFQDLNLQNRLQRLRHLQPREAKNNQCRSRPVNAERFRPIAGCSL